MSGFNAENIEENDEIKNGHLSCTKHKSRGKDIYSTIYILI